MARRSARAWPDREHVLVPERTSCPACDGFMRVRYENRRRLETLSGSVRLRLKVRRCEREDCTRRHKPYRPEAEGAIALPQHEFGLDVIALVGALRHREHRSIPEIHAALRGRGVEVCELSVTNLLDRYDELLAVSLTDSGRLRGLLAGQGRVILAIDGLQPDVGHEVLWVVRDCLSGEVLLARSLLSGTAADLAPLLREVAEAVGVPIAGMDEAKIVLLEGPVRLARPACGRQAAQALGFQDAIDRVTVQMRQKVADHKGEVIQRKARRTPQGADNGALLFGGFPGQLVRAAGVVLTVGRTALTPLADRLGRDAIALRQDTGWLP